MLKEHRRACDVGCCISTYDPHLMRRAGASVGHGRPMFEVIRVDCGSDGAHARCFGADAWALGRDDYWEIATGRAVFL